MKDMKEKNTFVHNNNHKKRIAVTLFVLSIFLLMPVFSLSSSAALSCAVRTSCNTGETCVYAMSSLANGHSELCSSATYANKVCCSADVSLTTSSGTKVLGLSASTNAHAEQGTLSSYANPVYLGATGADITCSYKTACSADETCLGSISASTNAQVGQCNAYPTNICCKSTTTAPPPGVTGGKPAECTPPDVGAWVIPEGVTCTFNNEVVNVPSSTISLYPQGINVYVYGTLQMTGGALNLNDLSSKGTIDVVRGGKLILSGTTLSTVASADGVEIMHYELASQLSPTTAQPYTMSTSLTGVTVRNVLMQGGTLNVASSTVKNSMFYDVQGTFTGSTIGVLDSFNAVNAVLSFTDSTFTSSAYFRDFNSVTLTRVTAPAVAFSGGTLTVQGSTFTSLSALGASTISDSTGSFEIAGKNGETATLSNVASDVSFKGNIIGTIQNSLNLNNVWVYGLALDGNTVYGNPVVTITDSKVNNLYTPIGTSNSVTIDSVGSNDGLFKSYSADAVKATNSPYKVSLLRTQLANYWFASDGASTAKISNSNVQATSIAGNSDVQFVNSNFFGSTWANVYGNSKITLNSSTLSAAIYATGTPTWNFGSSTIKGAIFSMVGDATIVRGNAIVGPPGDSTSWGFQWGAGTLTREYPVYVGRSGAAVTVTDASGVAVWSGISGADKYAYPVITFTSSNYQKKFTLTATNVGTAQIDIWTSTPYALVPFPDPQCTPPSSGAWVIPAGITCTFYDDIINVPSSSIDSSVSATQGININVYGTLDVTGGSINLNDATSYGMIRAIGGGKVLIKSVTLTTKSSNNGVTVSTSQATDRVYLSGTTVMDALAPAGTFEIADSAVSHQVLLNGAALTLNRVSMPASTLSIGSGSATITGSTIYNVETAKSGLTTPQTLTIKDSTITSLLTINGQTTASLDNVAISNGFKIAGNSITTITNSLSLNEVYVWSDAPMANNLGHPSVTVSNSKIKTLVTNIGGTTHLNVDGIGTSDGSYVLIGSRILQSDNSALRIELTNTQVAGYKLYTSGSAVAKVSNSAVTPVEISGSSDATFTNSVVYGTSSIKATAKATFILSSLEKLDVAPYLNLSGTPTLIFDSSTLGKGSTLTAVGSANALLKGTLTLGAAGDPINGLVLLIEAGSRISREYPVNVGAAGIAVKVKDSINTVIWSGTTDPSGWAYPVIVFDSANSQNSFTLEAAGYNAVTINFWTSTPITGLVPIASPSFTSTSVDPNAPSTQVTSTSVTISNDLSDGAGVSGVTATITDAQGNVVATIPLSLTSGTAQSGTWAATYNFPATLADGTYTITSTATSLTGLSSTQLNGYVLLDRTGATSSMVSIVPQIAKPADTVLVTVSASDSSSGISGVTARDTAIGESAVAMTLVSGTTNAGVTSTWQRTITAQLPEGVHTVVVAISDKATPPNVNTQSGTFTLDSTVPTAPAIAPSITSTSYIDSTPSFSWGASTDAAGVAGYVVSIDNQPFVNIGNVLSYTVTSPLSDGTHVFSVSAVDTAGNIGPASTVTFTTDTTPPTIGSITIPTSIVGTTAQTTITAQVNDATLGVNTVIAYIKGPSPSSAILGTATLSLASGTAQSGTWSGTFTFPSQLTAPDGTYTIETSAIDSAGNIITQFGGTVLLDRTGATSSVVSIVPKNAQPNTAVTVTASISDSGSGFSSQNSVTATDSTSGVAATLVTFSGSLLAGQTGTWTFNQPTALPEGTHTEIVTSTDKAGNLNTASGTFNVDKTPPAAPILSSPADSTITTGAMPTFAWSTVTDASLPVKYELLVDNNADFASSEISQKGLTASTFTATLPDGVYNWKARAVDDAGNLGAYSSVFKLTIDTVSPAFTSVAVSLDVASSVAAISNVVTDATSGVSSVTAYVKNSAGATVGTVSLTLVSGTWSGTFSFASLPDETYTISSTAVDAAGNSASMFNSYVLLDRAGAISSAVSIVPQLAKPTDSVVVTVSASDATSGILSVTARDTTALESAVAMALVSGTTGAGATSTWQRTITVQQPEGVHNVEVVISDKAAPSNINTQTGTFTVDATAPSIVSYSPTSTISSSATITLLTNENAVCKYSTTAGTAYASMTSSYVDGGTTHTLSLSGLTSGTYTFYTKCSDSIGNVNTADYPVVLNADIPFGTPCSPADYACALISASTGGCVASGDGVITFCVPAGALQQNTYIAVNPASSTTANLYIRGGYLMQQFFKIEPSGLFFNPPAQVTIKYNAPQQRQPNENSLTIWTSPDNTQWNRLKGVLDTSAQKVSAPMQHLSFIALVEQDITPANTTATISCTYESSPFETWCKDVATVALEAADTNFSTESGIQSIMYSFDNVNWQNYTTPIAVSTSGVTTVYYYSTDNAGNKETAKSASIKVDKDSDSDAVYDNFDKCLATAGLPDRQGCKIADLSFVEMHTVDLTDTKSLCNGKTTCKVPVAGAVVKTFNRNDATFQSLYTKNPATANYPAIFDGTIGFVSECTTDATGKCLSGEASTGDYLMIAKYLASDNKIVYTGKNKDISDFKDTNGDGIVDLASKDFQKLKIKKKDGTLQYQPGAKTIIIGSTLEIIYPEYAVWDVNETIYPFIFTNYNSTDPWTVDICASVPAGYKVVGDNCTQVFVGQETKVFAFTIVETGSPEPDTTFSITTTHKGKVEKRDISVKGKRSDLFNAKKDEQAKHKAAKAAKKKGGNALTGLAVGLQQGSSMIYTIIALLIFVAFVVGAYLYLRKK